MEALDIISRNARVVSYSNLTFIDEAFKGLLE
jgi:hypothetical protein